MSLRVPTFLALLTLVVACATALVGRAKEKPALPASTSQPPAAPEIGPGTAWINSPPLTIAGLKGRVAIVHFWTFGCINCQRNLPAYNAWQNELAKAGVAIVGVHTPELEHETVLDNVRQNVKQRAIKYPVVVDGNRAIWQAWQNRYWPAVYLVDRQGRVRYRWEGELAYEGAKGDETIRAKVQELLAEKAE